MACDVQRREAAAEVIVGPGPRTISVTMSAVSAQSVVARWALFELHSAGGSGGVGARRRVTPDPAVFAALAMRLRAIWSRSLCRKLTA
jgi:hypothetical protein